MRLPRSGGAPTGPEGWGSEGWGPRGEAQREGTEGWEAQHFALFPSRSHFVSCFFSLRGSSRGFVAAGRSHGPPRLRVLALLGTAWRIDNVCCFLRRQACRLRPWRSSGCYPWGIGWYFVKQSQSNHHSGYFSWSPPHGVSTNAWDGVL